MSLYKPLRDTWSTSLSVARRRLRPASYGVPSMIEAFTVFSHLTRPHVDAAFGRRPAKP